MGQRKILFITNRIPYPLRDGGNIAMNAMIEGYHRAGWQVYLLSMNTTRHHIAHEQLNKLFTHLYKFEWADVDNDIKWFTLLKNYLFSREPEHAKRFYKEHFAEKLKEVLQSFKPDVVQMESVYLTTYLPEIKRLTHAITVLRIHNLEYQIWQGLARKTRNSIKQAYLHSLTVRIRNFERAAWTQYDLLLPITEKDASQIGRLEEVHDMIVAPFSIDLDKIKQSTHAEKWVGYHIGAMDWIANQQGIHWFLEHAWPKIQRVAPSFEFYFAGRNMPEEFMKIDLPGVHCLNEVPSADEFIADKKILIVPLWSGGGIRVKILEAMAAGKIVITTSIGIKGIDAVAGEHYLSARKPEDFAKAIKWCLDNRQAAEAMAQNARDFVTAHYEQRKVITNVINEVNLLLGNK